MVKSGKKVLISTVIFFVVLLFAAATIIKEKEKNAPSLDVIVTDSPIVFYFGYNCPHCKIVEKYLTDNKVADKVRFSMKEVYKNEANRTELVEKAKICGVEKNLGVPLLWDGEKCYIGDEKIIEFFKAKAQGVSVTETGDPAAEVITFYYGQSCEKCQLVEQFISANGVEDKVVFARKEVTQNEKNNEEYTAKEMACNIAKDKIGVPLLTVGDKCYLGEEEIINFFKGKINEK